MLSTCHMLIMAQITSSTVLEVHNILHCH